MYVPRAHLRVRHGVLILCHLLRIRPRGRDLAAAFHGHHGIRLLARFLPTSSGSSPRAPVLYPFL
jgi:hypothetical protein